MGAEFLEVLLLRIFGLEKAPGDLSWYLCSSDHLTLRRFG